MNEWIQIYVIYFLTLFKMKKITLLFFTFSGIYSGMAQKTATGTNSTKAIEKIQLSNQPGDPVVTVDKDKPVVQIFPNPAKNKVELVIKGFDPGYLQVSLLNNNGKMIKEEKRLIVGGAETIVFMFSEKAGLYYILLKQGTRSIRTKLLIQ